jgi:pimeloyl-ACP methyl ester carboxylesterase
MRLHTCHCVPFLAALVSLSACAPPPPIPIPKDQAAFQRVLNTLLFDPDKTCEELRRDFQVEFLPLAETPDEIGLEFHEVWLLASDQVPLRVWYLPARLDRGTIVLSIGAVGSIPCFLFHAQLLVDDGWSVVLYDYRGFGQSNGTPDVAFLADDLNTVLDWTLWFTGRDRVTLMGVSLGTVPSVAVAAQRPEHVNGLILDSPLAMTRTIERLGFVLQDRTQVFLDLLDETLVSERLIRQVERPVLILVGENDRVTGIVDADLLAENAAGVVEQARFADVGHARAIFRDTNRYRFEVERFLTRIWNQAILPAETAVSVETDAAP